MRLLGETLQTAGMLLIVLGLFLLATGTSLGEGDHFPHWYGGVEAAVGIAFLLISGSLYRRYERRNSA